MYKISLHLKSFDLNSLIQTQQYLLSLFSFLNLNQIKNQIKPKKSKKVTILRSPHIDKKSREQFQLLSHKRTFSIKFSNKNLVYFLLEILKDLKLVGVELEMVMEFSTF